MYFKKCKYKCQEVKSLRLQGCLVNPSSLTCPACRELQALGSQGLRVRRPAGSHRASWSSTFPPRRKTLKIL